MDFQKTFLISCPGLEANSSQDEYSARTFEVDAHSLEEYFVQIFSLLQKILKNEKLSGRVLTNERTSLVY